MGQLQDQDMEGEWHQYLAQLCTPDLTSELLGTDEAEPTDFPNTLLSE